MEQKPGQRQGPGPTALQFADVRRDSPDPLQWSPGEMERALKQRDQFFDYRQIGIVTADGRAAAHSPSKGASYTGHRVGNGFVAMGNGLAGAQVVDAIHDSFEADESVSFLERLVRAIEAGFAAGGEPIGQKSAVADAGSVFPVIVQEACAGRSQCFDDFCQVLRS